jgi:phosphoglucomutase
MVYPIAENYGAKVFETLTGFKWIGEKVRQWEKDDSYRFMFGFEESYGCIISSHARDKDGISAVMALCEMAAFYKGKGISLYEQMQKIYEKYGFYKEKQISVVLKGADGAQEIKDKMERIRNDKITELGEFKVTEFRDYQNHVVVKADSTQSTTDLPTSNVLYFDLEDGAWCCVRPSGTEPKIKFYMGVKGENSEDASEKLEKLSEAMNRLVE